MNNLPLTIAKFISTGFGMGRAPVAPGTFGTLIGIPIVYYMQNLNLIQYGLLTAFLLLLGIWAANEYGKHLNEHDHSSIVWDEVVGYIITMFAVPATLTTLVIGFVVFRFFDIIKPWPIYVLDKKLKGGLGVMLDDVVAGLFGAVAMMAIHNYVGFQ